jgi:hypothetical protein
VLAVTTIVIISSLSILYSLIKVASASCFLKLSDFTIFISFNKIFTKNTSYLNYNTMGDNKSISIDIEINGNSQKQLDQYKAAFDGLRTSITNLSNPISKLDGDISKLTGSIGQLNKQNTSVADSAIKVRETYEALEKIYEGVEIAIGFLKTGTISLTTALTGGLSLLLTFGPELISIISSFFKGKEAVAQMTDKLKGFNEIMKAAGSDAAAQTAKLNLLYKSATDVKKSDDERAESIRLLKKEFPGYFEHLSTEDFKNGKANATYLTLTNSIIANARAKAALNKITEESAKILDAEYKIQKIKGAHAQEQQILNDKKKDLQEKAKRGGGHRSGLLWQVDEEIKKSNEREQQSLAAAQKIIDKTNKLITGYTKLGGGANKIAGIMGAENGDSNPSVSLNVNSGSRAGSRSRKRTSPVEAKREPSLEPEFNTGKFVKDSLDQSVQQSLEAKSNAIVKNTQLTHQRVSDLDAEAAKKRIALEEGLTKAKINFGEKFVDAALKNSKKDSAIFKAAFLAKKATAIADTIISTKNAVMESFKAYAGIPFIGQALGIAQAVFMGAQGAMSVAEIAKQKPGFAGGGWFRSDGKGALLSGYSRTDDTNAYLRSGEAVVVSEAMRNPWARNLVSAINVAHGGRDFSIANPGRGYAIGGIFTDGGNSNRYYSQPLNDQKDLANTIAYQMINNFPPVYVDVKDINTQQNILARTVDRVNL